MAPLRAKRSLVLFIPDCCLFGIRPTPIALNNYCPTFPSGGVLTDQRLCAPLMVALGATKLVGVSVIYLGFLSGFTTPLAGVFKPGD
jgi:hypothetical protein